MLKWAIRELLFSPQQLFANIAAVAGAFALVLFFEGIFAGESRQIVAMIDHTEADVWVMQKGVGNMHMATSFVADWKIDRVKNVKGVKKVTPILYLSSAIEAGGSNWFSFVVGLEAGDPRAGPWKHAGGAQLPAAGTAIVPDIFASDAGLKIGDTVRIIGRDFTISGFSSETFSMANSVTYVTLADLADAMSSLGIVSYMLVDADAGVAPQELAARIMDEVEGVNVLPRDDFIRRDYSIAYQMGLEIVWMMTVIGGILAVLLTGFIIYAHIAERERELAMMKALGVRNLAIYGATMVQAFTIGALALCLAIAAILLAIPLTEWLMPKVSLAMTMDALLKTAGLAFGVCLIASVLPVMRVLSVDPVTAFQQ